MLLRILFCTIENIKQKLGFSFNHNNVESLENRSFQESCFHQKSKSSETNEEIYKIFGVDFNESDFSIMMLTEILIENIKIELLIMKRAINESKKKMKYFKDPLKNSNYRQRQKEIQNKIKYPITQENSPFLKKSVRIILILLSLLWGSIMLRSRL